jgi:epoxyqueuosine reductase QueG
MSEKKAADVEDHPEQWVKEKIQGFIVESEVNRLALDGEVIYDEPLVGFARGDASLFRRYKKVIGKFHLTPLEWMKLALGEKSPRDLRARDLRVITWVLPITEKTRKENRRERKVTSRRWAYTRLYGEECNQRLRSYMVSVLEAEDYLALAPLESTIYAILNDSRVGRASNWSERHAAYAAGLGTFGLSDGLITPRGKAMRCGSIVTNLSVKPTPRPYQGRGDYCLFHRDGTCMECARRCPVGAITESGHDKVVCKAFTVDRMAAYVRKNYGIDIYGCGLCQTGVPCESGIPAQ